MALYQTTAVRFHGLFCHQGDGGARTIKGVIVDVLAVIVVLTTGQVCIYVR